MSDGTPNTTPGEFYKRVTGRGAWLIAQENVSGYVAEVFAGDHAGEVADVIVAHLNAKPKAKAKAKPKEDSD